MEKHEIKELAKVLAEELHSLHSAEYADKWEGGSVFFIPGNSDTKDHEMPLDKLMHKIVLIRDNLRVLEQQINSHPMLSESDRLKFQSYITKCYGSLTSFNFIFRKPEDKFSSK